MAKRSCYYCGQRMTKAGTDKASSLTWDHLTPRSRGGTSDPSNKVRACKRCNTKKRDMTESEFIGLRVKET